MEITMKKMPKIHSTLVKFSHFLAPLGKINMKKEEKEIYKHSSSKSSYTSPTSIFCYNLSPIEVII